MLLIGAIEREEQLNGTPIVRLRKFKDLALSIQIRLLICDLIDGSYYEFLRANALLWEAGVATETSCRFAPID